MTKFIPIFPLNVVVYPGQQLNLHIFEERYKQLINECKSDGKTFGIPSVFEHKLNDYGTEMEITEVSHVYADGKMDIKTKGVKVFRIVELQRVVPNKLYQAATVAEVPHLPFDTDELNPTLEELVNQLHHILGTGLDIYKKFEKPLSYELAPYVALNPEDQYRLLLAKSETQRQVFLMQHLMKILPNIEAAEKVRARVKMNGHFADESNTYGDDFKF